ncbi:UV DNA damage repair endonuclease UvsE [Candidatus Bipolaricaulota bacterium]|nr:UV DNA damage repair endonuclease UvsE [Candidatus Bipolaricaulota bacterium]
MRLGYPCINLSLSCRPSRTFRLASFTEERFWETVEGNLRCLEEIVLWNAAHGLLFLRITSDLVPFASHPQNRLPWEEWLVSTFAQIGKLIQSFKMRISMHPDQFVLLNSPNPQVVESSVAELIYHAKVLDLLGLDLSAKIQIHLGGAYKDKEAAKRRFIANFRLLPKEVRRRLVVENDDKIYTFGDCLSLSEKLEVPVVFDYFHHRLNPGDLGVKEALKNQAQTWKELDGPPMVDYSSGLPQGKKGQHARTLDEEDFRKFLEETRPYDFDLMLEIKDKERSALKALNLALGDPRLVATRYAYAGGRRED